MIEEFIDIEPSEIFDNQSRILVLETDFFVALLRLEAIIKATSENKSFINISVAPEKMTFHLSQK